MSEESNAGNAYHILSIFSTKYGPATHKTATDYFTSKEILKMVKDHIGDSITLEELHDTLRSMDYDYIMSGLEFKWLCRKE